MRGTFRDDKRDSGVQMLARTISQAVVHPLGAAFARYEARISEHFEMMRHGRLQQRHAIVDVADADLAITVRDQREDAQPMRIGQRSKRQGQRRWISRPRCSRHGPFFRHAATLPLIFTLVNIDNHKYIAAGAPPAAGGFWCARPKGRLTP